MVATVRNSIKPMITMQLDTVSTELYAISLRLVLHIDIILPTPRICAGIRAVSLQKKTFCDINGGHE